ncbi:MAG: c-type cytochrome [Actinobacteria bacterium]|nr:c-type cytochrome [Actinomycetota bacterium]
MHETLFFICGGVLAASAVIVSLVGLKSDDFPGKFMPVVIIWFAIFAVGAGTFAVLHGKDESKEHDPEYKKASEELTRASTSGPFEEALKEESESSEGESSEGEGEEPTAEEGAEEGGEETEAEEAGTSEGVSAEAGAAVFSENCSICHGATGEGGNGGPDLNTMPLAKTEEGVIQQVTNGGGGMPPFGGSLSEEEIKSVAAYVVQEITQGE